MCSYKEKLATYDDKLRSLRHKEREYISLERLKLRTEVGVHGTVAAVSTGNAPTARALRLGRCMLCTARCSAS